MLTNIQLQARCKKDNEGLLWDHLSSAGSLVSCQAHVANRLLSKLQHIGAEPDLVSDHEVIGIAAMTQVGKKMGIHYEPLNIPAVEMTKTIRQTQYSSITNGELKDIEFQYHVSVEKEDGYWGCSGNWGKKRRVDL